MINANRIAKIEILDTSSSPTKGTGISQVNVINIMRTTPDIFFYVGQ